MKNTFILKLCDTGRAVSEQWFCSWVDEDQYILIIKILFFQTKETNERTFLDFYLNHSSDSAEKF